MSVYYYKDLKILAPFSIVSNEPHFDIQTVSLKTGRVSQGHQRWELSFAVQPEGSETNNLFVDMLVSGQNSPDTMIMPQFAVISETYATYPKEDPSIELTFDGSSDSYVFGTAGALQVGIAAEYGDSTVTLDSSSARGKLMKGTFIKFSEGDKVYIVTSETDLSGSTAVVPIYPSLRRDLSTSATLQYGDDCIFSYYRDIGNSTGITFEDGVLANPGQITLYEAL